MTKKLTALILTLGLVAGLNAFAGDGFSMKCKAPPGKDGKSCGYEATITIGGGMLFEQVTGYCRVCKKFVYLRWTRANIPEQLKGKIKETPPPKTLGEVWDGATGKVMPLYACPTCQGPFMEIKKASDLKHCPVCNEAHFEIDTSKPRMAID